MQIQHKHAISSTPQAAPTNTRQAAPSASRNRPSSRSSTALCNSATCVRYVRSLIARTASWAGLAGAVQLANIAR